jgi:phosphonate transport system substrate-binding protein
MRQRSNVEPVIGIRRPEYRACLWTKRSTGITSVAQLKGKRVAMGDVGSTSAHLGPSQLLIDGGLDPLTDVRVRNVGDTAQEALKRGDVEAVGFGCHNYDRFMQRESNPDDYPVLARSGPLPPDVLLARRGLGPEFVQRVRDAFQRDWNKLLAAMLVGEDNQKYANAELVMVSDRDFDVVRSMYRAIGVTEFDEFVGS